MIIIYILVTAYCIIGAYLTGCMATDWDNDITKGNWRNRMGWKVHFFRPFNVLFLPAAYAYYWLANKFKSKD